MMTQLALETSELLTGSIKQGKKETANTLYFIQDTQESILNKVQEK